MTDPHGNVVQLTDEQGKVIKTYEYDSFGNEVNPDSKDENPFRYCGEYYDKETEEVYLRARYYESAVGRFLTRDTYTGEEDEPESLHLYAYCGYDGVNAWDPSGHSTQYPSGMPTNDYNKWIENKNKKVDKYLKPSKLKKKYGKIFKKIIKQEKLKIKVKYMGGAALQESIGAGFLGNHRLNIRMETHIFSERTKDKYKNYIRRKNGKRQYREKENMKWKTIDADNQNQNYKAFNIAKNLNKKGGYESISMGMFQIMGFNYKPAGYGSAKNMFNDYKKGIKKQVLSYAKFLRNYSGGKLLKCLRNNNIAGYAKIYNGGDPEYGSQLKNNIKRYKDA